MRTISYSFCGSNSNYCRRGCRSGNNSKSSSSHINAIGTWEGNREGYIPELKRAAMWATTVVTER